MIQRQRQRLPHWSGRARPRGAPPLPPVVTIRPDHTVPLAPAPGTDEEEPAILGFPAEFAPDDAPPRPVAGLPGVHRPGDDVPGDEMPGDAPADLLAPGPAAAGTGFPVHLVVVPRSEPWGAVALLLAGLAADASLWLPWWRDPQVTGVQLVRQGLAVLGSGPGALGHSGLWPPVVVVLGGGVQFLLGLLLFRRARSHRPAGLLALLVALAAATGVVVPLANADWTVRSFGPGMWCAVTVVLLGGLGALKAMLTAPRVRPEVG
jgi:hypothetical protein